MTKLKYGWKPQLPDHRDFRYVGAGILPASVSALTTMIPAYDQKTLGSCTANGNGRIWQHRMYKEGKSYPVPSRLFIYYNERVLEGDVSQDGGAPVRAGLKVLAKYGAPPETDWPYVVSKFAAKPPAKAYTDALKDIALQYQAVSNNLTATKQAIAAGNPVVFGFTVFESFESDVVANTGVMPMPSKNEQVLGGHCVVMDGYNDASQRFICANSWGTSWGQNGWFTMPYANLINCSDFWVLLKVQ